jgi:hypothetical protein
VDVEEEVADPKESEVDVPAPIVVDELGMCKKCDRPVGADDAKAKASERTKLVEHKQCAAAFKALSRRWSKTKALKAMWEAKTPDEKVLWYIDNTAPMGDLQDAEGGLVKSLANVNKQGVKRKLTTDVEVVQSESVAKHRRVQDIGLNFNKWSEKELLKRVALGGDPKKVMNDLTHEWKLLLVQDDIDKEKINGEWIIYEFNGVIRERVESSATAHIKRVKAAIENADDKALLDDIAKSALGHAREDFDKSRVSVHRPSSVFDIDIPDELVQGILPESSAVAVGEAVVDKYLDALLKVEELQKTHDERLRAAEQLELQIFKEKTKGEDHGEKEELEAKLNKIKMSGESKFADALETFRQSCAVAKIDITDVLRATDDHYSSLQSMDEMPTLKESWQKVCGIEVAEPG